MDDEEIDGVSDNMIGKDTGDLRPMNEIQTFVQTRSRKRQAETMNKKTIQGHIPKPVIADGSKS